MVALASSPCPIKQVISCFKFDKLGIWYMLCRIFWTKICFNILCIYDYCRCINVLKCQPFDDVDIVISARACQKFYRLALAFHQAGFIPVRRIADPKLAEYLSENGIQLTEMIREDGHGLSWIDPQSRIGLDVSFGHDNFYLLQGHQFWTDDRTHQPKHLLRTLKAWKGCHIAFDSPIRTSLGLLSASGEALIQIYNNQIKVASRVPILWLDRERLRRYISELGHT